MHSKIKCPQTIPSPIYPILISTVQELILIFHSQYSAITIAIVIIIVVVIVVVIIVIILRFLVYSIRLPYPSTILHLLHIIILIKIL